MSSKRAEKIFQILLWATALGAIVGLALLITHATSVGLALFELITFTFSLVAVTLAILGSITGIQQSRTMSKISREMQNTLKELQVIDHDNELIKKKIQQDYKLAQEIADTLLDMGVDAQSKK